MAGFENQPTTPASGKQRTRTFSEESSSEISSPLDLQERLRREKSSRKETDEVYQRLQEEYDELLKKYAQAENTIDQLKIGAKLNLYSDLPPPQQSSFVNVSAHRQPGVLRFPRSNQAVFSDGSVLGGDINSPSGVDGRQQNGNKRGDTSFVDLHQLTPDWRSDSLRTELSPKVQAFQEDVDALQDHVMEGQWGEPELRELRDMCEQLRLQNANLKRELDHINRLEGNNEGSFTGEFLPEDSLEGQLYRCGLRLEEIKDQLGENASFGGVESLEVRRNSYSEVLNRPRDNHREAAAEENRPDSDLQHLMQRLRNIKEASKNDESRDGNSSEDVEDLDLNSVGRVQDNSRRFSLGPIPDSDGEETKQRLGDLAGPVDLQESGYFASESMSVVNDPASEPLSNQYFANSEGPRDRSRGGSFAQTSPHRPSVSSTSGQRSRSASHRSRANTMDMDSLPEDDGENDVPSSGLPSPHTSPDGSKSPQASSSPLRDGESGIPTARRRDSRLSETGSRRSRASSNASRLPPASVVSNNDSLRDTGPVRDPDDSFLSRDRTASTRSSPREPHVPQEPRGSFASRNRAPSIQSTVVDPPGVFDGNARKSSKVTPGNRPLRASMSGDSRVSTPLFLPNADTGARPNGTRGRDKHRLGVADTERGFDSGFFGSEGSRISRGHESPDIPPHYSYPENKLRGVPLQEQSETETEGERLITTAPKPAPKLNPRNREQRRRRSYLQSLSESDEDRELEAAHSKTSVRTPSSGPRERRSHRHTPTHPATRSDNEATRRLDDGLRRHVSSPNLYEPGAGERSGQSTTAGRSVRTPSRHDTSATPQRTGGPRSEPSRPMDKQSVRSYPGDRESVRSGRRRGGESSSGYSDTERRYRRDPVNKLREELQRLRDQLQQEATNRGTQAQMYDDLRRRHDDLEREMARRGAEQQMASMYDGLRKKYETLANDMSRSREQPETNPSLYEDLRKRLEELAKDVDKIKQKESERPPPSPSLAQTAPVSTVRFLCPFCGGSGIHSHGEYFYPGYAGPRDPSPVATVGTPPHSRRHTETQTPYSPRVTNTFIGHPTTPAAASTPYYHNAVSSPLHHHTHTYPGVVTYPGMVTGSPLVHSPGVVTETPTVHHIHHLPRGRHRSRREHRESDTDDSDSDEGFNPRTRRVRIKKSPGNNRSSWGSRHEEELESYRLHQSLDEANRAARRMQRLSKRMLGSIASDLIRSGKR